MTSNSPRKFTLVKSASKKQDTEIEKSKITDADAKATTPHVQVVDKNEKLGFFQHSPHYMNIYSIIKGAFKNYQVSPISTSLDKFTSFVKSVLESFSMLLELATFVELGPYVEELLEYLKAVVLIDEEASFLALQQVIFFLSFDID